MDRWIALEGCNNLRDVGGYATRDGRLTRWGLLYRSDTLARVSDEAMSRARGDLPIRSVIDLRTGDEVERLGTPAWFSGAGVEVNAVPMANPAIAMIRKAGAEGMGELYLWNLDEKQQGFGRIVQVLADPTVCRASSSATVGKIAPGSSSLSSSNFSVFPTRRSSRTTC